MAMSGDGAQTLENGMFKLQPNGKYLCICNAELMKASIKRHLLSKKHLEKVSEPSVHGRVSRSGKSSSDVGSPLLFASFCDKTSIYVTPQPTRTTSKQSDVAQTLENGMFTLQPNGKYLCICNAELMKASIKRHLLSEKHLEKVSKPSVHGRVSHSGKTSSDVGSPLLFASFCDKTPIHVTPRPTGTTSKQSDVTQTLENGMFKLLPNGKYLCICNAELMKASIKRHLLSEKHLEKVSEPSVHGRVSRSGKTSSDVGSPLLFASIYDKTPIYVTPQPTGTTSKQKTPIYVTPQPTGTTSKQGDGAQTLENGMFKLQPNGKYLCICNAELMKASIKKHLLSKKHLEKVSEPSVHGRVSHSGKTSSDVGSPLLFASACEKTPIYVTPQPTGTTSKQSDAAQTLENGMFTLQPNGKYLCICNAELMKASIKKHLLSKKHLEKVSKPSVHGRVSHSGKTSSDSDVAQALQDGTFTLQQTGKYLCVCSSELQKASLKGHLSSNRHKAHTFEMTACDVRSRTGEETARNEGKWPRSALQGAKPKVEGRVRVGTGSVPQKEGSMSIALDREMGYSMYQCPTDSEEEESEESESEFTDYSFEEEERVISDDDEEEEEEERETSDYDEEEEKEERAISDCNKEEEKREIGGYNEEEEKREIGGYNEEEEKREIGGYNEEEEKREMSGRNKEEEKRETKGYNKEEEKREMSECNEEEEEGERSDYKEKNEFNEEEEESSPGGEEGEFSQEEEKLEHSQGEGGEELSHTEIQPRKPLDPKHNQEKEEELSEDELHIAQLWESKSQESSEEEINFHLLQLWDSELSEEESQQSEEESQQSEEEDNVSLSRSMETYQIASRPRGNVYIFNYKFTGKSNHRSGAEHDPEKLQVMFTKMGYRVSVKEDLSRRATLTELKLIRESESLKEVDCMIMFILSHGKGVRDFLTEDGSSLSLPRIQGMFTDAECPALRGKPKIFFANFCRRGDFETCPNFKASDFPRDVVTIHAAGEGLDALRSTLFGTFFVRNLCQVVQEHAARKSLREIYLELDRSATERGGTQPMWEDFAFRKFYFNPTEAGTETRRERMVVGKKKDTQDALPDSVHSE